MPIDRILIVVPAEAARRQAEQAFLTLPAHVTAIADPGQLATPNGDIEFDWVVAAEDVDLGFLDEYPWAEARLTRRLPLLCWRSTDAGTGFIWKTASDVLTGPITPDQALLAWRRAEHWRLAYDQAVWPQRHSSGSLLQPDWTGPSPTMDQLRRKLRKAALSDVAILVEGESGTGKSAAARAVHEASPRRDGVFLSLDCCGLDGALLAARLFGQERAETSGVRRRSAGALECAQGGTLVLENIHRLPAPLQQPLLDVLQHGAFQRSGGKETLTWQGRLVVTSARPLADVLAEGLLREDLFHVLNVSALTVPPLRERREDIPMIADSMRDYYRQRLGVEALAIAGAANEWLSARNWPGNVLELEQTVRSGISRLRTGQVLEIEHFQGPAESTAAAASSLSPAEDLASMEREHIFEILRRCDNNRTHAARRLGISIRTLRNKLRDYRQQAGD